MIKILLISALASLTTSFSEKAPGYMLISSSTGQKDPVKERKLKSVHSEIESLANLREYYVAKMTRYRARAARYEFQGANLEVSKELAQLADQIEGIVKQIETELARLEQMRQVLEES